MRETVSMKNQGASLTEKDFRLMIERVEVGIGWVKEGAQGDFRSQKQEAKRTSVEESQFLDNPDGDAHIIAREYFTFSQLDMLVSLTLIQPVWPRRGRNEEREG